MENDLHARAQTLARLRCGRIGVSDSWDSGGGSARDNSLTPVAIEPSGKLQRWSVGHGAPAFGASSQLGQLALHVMSRPRLRELVGAVCGWLGTDTRGIFPCALAATV